MLRSLLAPRCPTALIRELLVLALFFTFFPASAQKEQLVLWKVAGNGLKQPSYLFGTVHTIPFALLEKFPVKRYLDQAQFGVFEVAGRPIAPAPPTQASTPARHQPPLDSLFSKKDYALVDSFFAASPLGSIKAHNTDASLLTMMYAVKRLTQNPATELIGLDDGLAREMQRRRKPIFSLDPDEDPDRKAMETNYPFLASGIVYLIRESNNKGPLASRNTEAAYVAHLSEPLKLNEEASGLQRELTVRRNLVWLPALEQKMQEGSCFVAVGLAHLQYNDGLIKLLRQKGYKVKQIALPKNK